MLILFASNRRTKRANQADLWTTRVAMRQETGGKACSSPGLATGASAKVPRNESWLTSTTVSLACVSPNLRGVGTSLFGDMTEGFCFFSPLFRFCWQQRPSGVPGFSVVRGQSGAGHLGLGEERGQPLSAASSIASLLSKPVVLKWRDTHFFPYQKVATQIYPIKIKTQAHLVPCL